MMESSDEVVYMDRELEKAAEEGDVSFLENAVSREKEGGDGNFHYFLRESAMCQSNILQLAIWQKQYEWVAATMKLLPTHVIQKLLRQIDWEGDTALHVAAYFYCKMEIVKLLDEFVYQNDMKTVWRMQNQLGNTPLHCAAKTNNIELVKYLLEKQPGLASILNNAEGTFLHLAAQSGNISIIKAFDEIGEDQDHKMKMWSLKNEEGNTPLDVAVIENKDEVSKYLVEKHPDLTSILNNNHETVLHIAVTRDKMCIIKAVDETGDDEDQKMKMWSVTNAEGNTPLHVAVIEENDEVVKYLVEKHPGLSSILNNSDTSSIHLAAAKGNISFFIALDKYADEEELKMKLLSLKNTEGNTPLHFAAIHSKAEVLQFLVARWPELVRAVNNKKETPLHVAIKHYETAVDTKAIERGEMLRAIEILVEIESGVACLPDADGFTPLHRAASLCTAYNSEVVRFILQHSSQSAEVLDNFGNNILHLMINNISSCKQGTKLLTISEVNALRNTMNHQGKTPLDLAREKNFKMVRVLLDDTTKYNDLQMMKKQRTIMEEYGEIEEETIIRKRVQKFGMNFLLSRDVNKRNVLHKLLHINRKISLTVEAYVDLVHEILVRHPILVCQKDVNGDTPVHVLVRTPPNIQCRPHSNEKPHSSSIETSDFLSKLLDLCRVYYYKAIACAEGSPYDSPWLVQNIVENTPLHEALIANCPIKFVRQLIELDIERVGGIMNNNKETPLHLLADRPSMGEQDYEAYEDTITLIEAYEDAVKLPDKCGVYPLQRAISAGNFGRIVALWGGDYLEEKKFSDVEGHTLLHEIIDQSPPLRIGVVKDLICQIPFLKKKLSIKDKKGKTPLHLAIEYQYFEHARCFIQYSVEVGASEIQDNEGNTWLHLAVLGGHYESLNYDINALKDDSRSLWSITNKKGKTPLHLFIEHQHFEIAKTILEASTYDELKVHDNEGNTPLHSAIHGGHFEFIYYFLEIIGSNGYPDLRKLLLETDKKGKTPLHLAIEQCIPNLNDFLKVSNTLEEFKVQDIVGNTPLHLAIRGGYYELVLGFLQLAVKKQMEHLLEIENKDGQTLRALIGAKKELPSQLKTYLMTEPTLGGIISMYGIANTEMKEYVNTMGVIAALLATITFTAALSFPGGPKQDDGTPILIKHASFQAFMFFDVLTMCLSTMVLFRLLCMITESGRKSVMLMDFSIWLLQISFYTTLLTFMTGVYAANFTVKPWIGIYTIVLCSLLMLLMRKKILSDILGPSICTLRSLLVSVVTFNFPGSIAECCNIIVLYGKTMLISFKKLLRSQQEEHSGQV